MAAAGVATQADSNHASASPLVGVRRSFCIGGIRAGGVGGAAVLKRLMDEQGGVGQQAGEQERCQPAPQPPAPGGRRPAAKVAAGALLSGRFGGLGGTPLPPL